MFATNIAKKLEELIGKEIHPDFGQPFIKIFEQTYSGKHEEVLAAAYCCSLFLSCLLAKMPTEILHTFTYYTKERYHRFSFNCKMYETLFAKTGSNDLKSIYLINEKREGFTRSCSKQDIFEAFDFYTNQ